MTESSPKHETTTAWQRLVSVAALLAALLAAPPATAEVITVTNSSQFQLAFLTVAEGDVIELAAGTYVSPVSGFEIFNPGRSFTIRAVVGASVVLTGEGTHPVLEFQNTYTEPNVSLVFENLVFADGLSTQDGIAGGVTLVHATATFVSCVFRDCAVESDTTGGGGAAVFSDSIAHFIDCEFNGNSARAEGGALKVGGASFAAIHDSRFIANRTNVPNHRRSAAGGAIHVGNASAMISNCRFEANRSGFAGGALYVIGSWDGTSTYAGDALVVNSTFTDNSCAPAVGVTPPSPTAGGAINVEDDARVRVFNSRLVNNSAETGGAVSSYRAVIELFSSVLEDNQATGDGSSSGLGGTLSVGSNDTTADGVTNRPAATVSLIDSLVVGHRGGGALKGGCLYVQGDTNRQFGFNGVTPLGTFADNRAHLTIAGSSLLECDVVRDDGVTGTGAGGAISVNLVDLEVQGSIIADNRAIGTNSAGGGIRISNGSLAVVTDTAFAANSAENSGGALWVIGSQIEITGCSFSGHSLGSGFSGSIMWLTPWDERDLDVSGVFADNVLSDNGQLEVWDQDEVGGNVSNVQFDRNHFDLGGGDADVYEGTQLGLLTVSQLNASQLSSEPNTVLASAPDLAAMLAVPPGTIPVAAAGDPIQSTASYLVYAWSGDGARLDGLPLAAPIGMVAAAAGPHELSAGSAQMIAVIDALAAPAATLSAAPTVIARGDSATLNWSSTGGSFRALTVDRNTTVTNPAPAGSATVSPDGTSHYRLLALYDEGGAVADATVWVDESPPTGLFADNFEDGSLGAWSAVAQ